MPMLYLVKLNIISFFKLKKQKLKKTLLLCGEGPRRPSKGLWNEQLQAYSGGQQPHDLIMACRPEM